MAGQATALLAAVLVALSLGPDRAEREHLVTIVYTAFRHVTRQGLRHARQRPRVVRLGEMARLRLGRWIHRAGEVACVHARAWHRERADEFDRRAVELIRACGPGSDLSPERALVSRDQLRARFVWVALFQPVEIASGLLLALHFAEGVAQLLVGGGCAHIQLPSDDAQVLSREHVRYVKANRLKFRVRDSGACLPVATDELDRPFLPHCLASDAFRLVFL